MKRGIAVAVIVCMVHAPSVFADAAIITRTTSLRNAPDVSAEPIAELEAGTAVKTTQRVSSWYQVNVSENQQGWVRLYHLRLEETEQKQSINNALGDLFKNTGRGSTRSGGATTGIRGLSEEEIKAAKPDLEKLQALDEFAVNEHDAKRFAQDIDLKASKIAYFDYTEPESEESEPSGEPTEEKQ